MERDYERVTMKRKTPSLVDLCVQKAIDNVRYLGDVGETALHLLERILPHCTLDQLMYIENSTEGRDLSPVTDTLWKKFFKLQFGEENAEALIDRMKNKKVVFKWKELYEAKLEDVKTHEQEAIARLKERYKKEVDRKQSRQLRLCTKVPPSSNKRSFYGSGPGSSIGYTKSNLMKKAKLDYLNSREVKNAAALKKMQSTQQRYSAPIMRKPQSAPIMRKPQSAPIIGKPQSAPIINRLQSAPIINRLQSAPIINRLQSAPIINKLQSAPIINRLQSAPIINKLQSAPITRKPQSAPIIKKTQSAPYPVKHSGTIREPQSAPIIKKPQSAHYPVKHSGGSSSSSSTPSRFAGDLLKQRRYF